MGSLHREFIPWTLQYCERESGQRGLDRRLGTARRRDVTRTPTRILGADLVQPDRLPRPNLCRHRSSHLHSHTFHRAQRAHDGWSDLGDLHEQQLRWALQYGKPGPSQRRLDGWLRSSDRRSKHFAASEPVFASRNGVGVLPATVRFPWTRSRLHPFECDERMCRSIG